jgi:hypothetical protein
MNFQGVELPLRGPERGVVRQDAITSAAFCAKELGPPCRSEQQARPDGR